MSAVMAMLLFLIFLGGSVSLTKSEPIVKTSLGLIRGTTESSHNGNKIYAFRGIPYAKSHIDNIRFKPPKPIEAWEGILNATDFGPDCNEHRSWKTDWKDCLRLNVYTYHINKSENITRPVLVFLPGAGHYFHHTFREKIPGYLLDNDIVAITVNFRLGRFGFFSTGDNYAPGNYGLKDQVEALKWVKNNIQFFGGDSSQITLGGIGFGAASVGLHLVSPMSRGLFHRAIMLSGSPISFWSTVKEPSKVARILGKYYGCPSNSSQDIIEYIQSTVPEEESRPEFDFLGLHLTNFTNSNDTEIFEALLTQDPAYAPVVEPENEDSDRFLVKEPIDSLLQGDFANVPVLLGTTRYELAEFVEAMYGFRHGSNVFQKLMKENWDSSAPLLFHYERNDTVTSKISHTYFESSNGSITFDSFEEWIDLVSDYTIRADVVRTAKLIAKNNTKPVYLYQLNYLWGNGENSWFGPFTIRQGTDLVATGFLESSHTTNEDEQFVKKYTTLWKNFIETGNPTPEVSEALDNVTWTPFTNEHPAYLDINATLTVRDGIFNQDKISLWESIHRLPDTSN